MDLIDVFIDEKIPFESINSDMVRVTAKGITIPVVSISHLKMLKKAAGRTRRILPTSKRSSRWRTWRRKG